MSCRRSCPRCLTVLEEPVQQSHGSIINPFANTFRFSPAELHGRWKSAEVSSEAYPTSLVPKPAQPRFGEQCHDPGCDSRAQPGRKYCINHQFAPEHGGLGSAFQGRDTRPEFLRNTSSDAVKSSSASLHVNTNGSPQTLTNSPSKLPANSRLGPEFGEKAGKTARKGGRGPPGAFSPSSLKRPRPGTSSGQDGPPTHLKQSLQSSPQRVVNGSPQMAPPPNFTQSPQNRPATGLRVYPVKYSPAQRPVTANAVSPKIPTGSTTEWTPSKPPRPPMAAQETRRSFTPSELLDLEAKAEQWHVKQRSSLEPLVASPVINGGANGAGRWLGARNGATAQHEPFTYTHMVHPEKLSAKVSEILLKHGITKPTASSSLAKRTTLPRPGKRRKLDGVAEHRARLFQSFDQASFDSVFYGQEDACTPPAGITATERRGTPPPLGEDNRLYLPLDPRIHWPRSWTDEWYEAKMREIRARGGRKANWGRATERMRERRLQEAEFSRREEAAIRADKTPPRREPQPWAHQRPIGFGDVPDEELPEDVKNDDAWRNAAAWMRSTSQRTAERDRQAEKLLAEGKSIEHLLGPTGW